MSRAVADLLPDNRDLHEESLAVSTDPFGALLPEIEARRGFRYERPLDETIGPWLVLEYGLGPIADFFGTVEDLIDEGRAWQRIRGTPAALEAALGWIGYDAIDIEDQDGRNRRRWHLYQVGMGDLPGEDEAERLAYAEYLAGLSDPARSEMFRGFHGYDIRALRLGNGRFGQTLLGDSSGVRIDGGRVKWSHGRTHLVTVRDTISDWEPYGWDATLDAASEDFGSWSETLSWDTPNLYWDGTDSEIAVKTWLLAQKQAHLVFLDADDAPIGYARVIRAPVDTSGVTGTISVDYEVRLPFGAGDEAEATRIAVVHDLAIAEGVKPFKAWMRPSEVVPGSGRTVGRTAFQHRFQRTVRETVRFSLLINLAVITPLAFGNPAFRIA